MIKTPRNLTRNLQAGCVMARIMRNKVQYAKNFSLTEYGSWKIAERAAAAWLGAIKATLPPPLTSKDRSTARNVSGFVGVSLKSSPTAASESVYYDWHATWPDNPYGTRWAVEKYGDNPAFVRAVLSRKLETADREEIEHAFAQVRGTAEYRSILRHKALQLVHGA